MRVEKETLFLGLTPKQREVLDLLIDNRTSKEIARVLGISESAVNQRIEPLRQRAGGLSRAQLARAYRATMQAAPYKQLTGQNFHLSPDVNCAPDDSEEPITSPSRTTVPAALERAGTDLERGEPRVVPEVLDGADAVRNRLLYSLKVAGLILAVIVLGMAVARSVGEMF